mmetsp:Transcript_21052/g.35656  ORF Transcript_21052/g.35656 Transcript_21052/m.35656 type:complete len:183 (-) Transcript_21052:126-674(-)
MLTSTRMMLKKASMAPAARGISRAMSTGPVTEDEVKGMLKVWGGALCSIAKTHREGGDYVAAAEGALDAAYGYGKGTVLFKPTLASGEQTFRGDKEGALSYFVGGNPKYAQDGGFAIKPWASADFYIAGIITGEKHGIVMGNKLLKDVDDNLTVANFTMGFFRDTDGSLKINLHHSSLPFTP